MTADHDALRHAWSCGKGPGACSDPLHEQAAAYMARRLAEGPLPHAPGVSQLLRLVDVPYGRCSNCGGQEPAEVLAQMDGYCSSECAREDRG